MSETDQKKKPGRPRGSKVKFTLRSLSTGESVEAVGYGDAAARLGILDKTLVVYLANGRGRTIRRVWRDDLGRFDEIEVIRHSIDKNAGK